MQSPLEFGRQRCGGALFFGGAVCWPSTSFLFQLEPSIDVVGKEPGLRSWKVPDFVHVVDLVAATNGLFQFRRTPCTGEGTFVVGMLAGRKIVMDAGMAE